MERLNKKLKRRANEVGKFPNEDRIQRLIGTVLFEKNDDWQSQHRRMMPEGVSQTDTAQIVCSASCDPQAPRPRGSNENTNGLRRYD